ncbi:hypothetical protein C2W62_44690 [Candidatus Entotheonella serta]|nr:hypothetical protein C2W62_44690 [Candidatus Entotheonella serta]
MGKILPITYALLEKDKERYGLKCGFLYFINSVETLFGAIFLSYIFLYFTSIDIIYKINIGIILSIFFLLLYRDRQYKLMTAGAVLSCIFLFGADWNRKFHVAGLFRERKLSGIHFNGPFNFGSPIDNHQRKLEFFADGPNTTVGVIKALRRAGNGPEKMHRAIYVNGKSDSSTDGDYSTLHLTAYLPYIFSPPNHQLRSAIIGQGTGGTAGVLAQFQDISHVDLIEISQAVIEPDFDTG